MVVNLDASKISRWVDQNLDADSFELWKYTDASTWVLVPYQIDELVDKLIRFLSKSVRSLWGPNTPIGEYVTAIPEITSFLPVMGPVSFGTFFVKKRHQQGCSLRVMNSCSSPDQQGVVMLH